MKAIFQCVHTDKIVFSYHFVVISVSVQLANLHMIAFVT